MKYYFYCLFSVLFFVVSCKKKDTKQTTVIKKTGMNTVVNHKSYRKIDSNFTKKIKDWKEYFIVDEFMNQFEKTNPTNALDNALELKKITKHLKDSLNIDLLKTSAFKARLNVFENEVLRLSDMTYIPSITSKDVNSQVKKVISLFESVNDKINTVYTKKRFDKLIKIDSVFANQ